MDQTGTSDLASDDISRVYLLCPTASGCGSQPYKGRFLNPDMDHPIYPDVVAIAITSIELFEMIGALLVSEVGGATHIPNCSASRE